MHTSMKCNTYNLGGAILATLAILGFLGVFAMLTLGVIL